MANINKKLITDRMLTLPSVFQGLFALLKVRLFKKRIPLLISWPLTFRCNQKCKYCGVGKLLCPELNTSEVLDTINKFHNLGTKWITFSGGEPLLREDMGEIINHTKSKGIHVFINSNGRLVPQKISELGKVDGITLSLDGPVEINDLIRGKGSFRRVIEAIEICQDNKIPVALMSVLTKQNIDFIDDVISIASKYNVRVMFQPATEELAYSNQPNPFTPPVKKHKKIMEELIDYKKRGAPIANSLTGLRYLSKWPLPTEICCSAGVLACSVNPDGSLLACPDNQECILDRRERGKDAIDRFINLPLPTNCSQCGCAPMVEINLISSLHLEPVFNLLVPSLYPLFFRIFNCNFKKKGVKRL